MPTTARTVAKRRFLTGTLMVCLLSGVDFRLEKRTMPAGDYRPCQPDLQAAGVRPPADVGALEGRPRQSHDARLMFDLEGNSNDSDSLKRAGACSSCREQRDEHYRCVPPCSRSRSSDTLWPPLTD